MPWNSNCGIIAAHHSDKWVRTVNERRSRTRNVNARPGQDAAATSWVKPAMCEQREGRKRILFYPSSYFCFSLTPHPIGRSSAKACTGLMRACPFNAIPAKVRSSIKIEDTRLRKPPFNANERNAHLRQVAYTRIRRRRRGQKRIRVRVSRKRENLEDTLCQTNNNQT